MTNDSITDVLSGNALFACEQGDALDFLGALPADAVDLVVGSPPYESARLYLENGRDLGIARDTETWVAWMVEVTKAALRVCTGAVVWVVEGQTRNYRWSASPMLLAADLVRAGIALRKPPIYRRSGIPGSGGPDWFRNDYELCIVATRGGPLPWSDNTACGHPPKYGPGGEMSNRTASGRRINQGGNKSMSARNQDGSRQPTRPKPSHVIPDTTDVPGQLGLDGEPVADNVSRQETFGMTGNVNARPATGFTKQEGRFRNQPAALPVIANPGNVIDCGASGGGNLGSAIAHESEAPYSEQVPERFIRSCCPPGGVVLDCFAGSGTTFAVAVRWGRRVVGCDLRASQVALTLRRVRGETPPLPGLAAGND
jgi:hypothetical protein